MDSFQGSFIIWQGLAIRKNRGWESFWVVLVTEGDARTAWVACVVGWFWAFLQAQEDGSIMMGQYVILGILHAGASLGILATCRLERLQSVNPNLIEGVSIALLLSIQLLTLLMDGYYAVRVFHGQAVEFYCSDSRLLLGLLSATVAGHLLLSVRFSRLLVLDVLTNLIYMVAILCYGSPEGTLNSMVNVAMLAIATCLVGCGHHKMERLERTNFTRIVQERVLRVQSEFELDRHKRNDGQTNDTGVHPDGSEMNMSSAAKTHISSIIAGGPAELLERRLEALQRMGAQEGWYISSSDLTVNRPLGSGGFGVVLQGTMHHSAVAAKVAATSLTQSLDEGHHGQVDALLNEIRLLRRIRHPNIVTFFGACVETSLQVMVIEELVRGQSLKQFIDESSCICPDRPWREGGLGRILLGICAGMAHLHDQAPMIVHGDLKPTNVMLSLDWTPKLIDFGLSGLLSKPRKSGLSRGWCAPEIHRKHALKSSEADVFSFGCITFFVGTSVRPFASHGRNLSDIDLPWPALLSDFQVQCRALCDQSVVLEPEDRGSAEDLLSMLAEMAHDSTRMAL